MKLFKTVNNEIIRECCCYFKFLLPSELLDIEDIFSKVSKFRDPWNKMTVGCFNAPAPHIPSWTIADTAKLFSFMFMSNQLSSITQVTYAKFL